MAIIQRELQLPLVDRRHTGRFVERRLDRVGAVMTLALAAAALWLVYSLIGIGLSWGRIKLDDIRYGYPRTFQTDGYVGYGELSGLPTHFTVINAHRQVLILLIPGTDPERVTVIKGPYLFGPDQEFEPATLTLLDVNHDGYADLVLHVAGQTITYLNDPSKHTFVVAHTQDGASR